MAEVHDLIVIGAGPAGLTAAIYAARAGLDCLLLEKETLGGQIMNVERIENYPGFAEGLSGAMLGQSMLAQTMNLGVTIELAEVEGIELRGSHKVVRTAAGAHRGKALILGSGAHPRKLGVPGEEELTGKGVIYCATCEGSQFAGRAVAVAGGGDSGLTEALSLARLASRVIVLEVLPQLSATQVLRDRAQADPKIEVRCGTRIEAIQGDDRVRAVQLVDTSNGKWGTLEIDGVLVHVGIDPNTGYLKGIVPLDARGQVQINQCLETEVPGIFAAGDVRASSPMQVATAVGDGATAAIAAERYLRKLGPEVA